LRAYLLNEHSADYAAPGGFTTSPERRVFNMNGAVSHTLPFGLRARGQVDYSSNVIAMQSFYTDVNQITRNRRGFGGNVVGSWGVNSLNVVVNRQEDFYSATDSFLYGDTPRVAFNRSERPLFPGAPVYFSMATEYIGIERQSRREGTTPIDSGLTRLHLAPQLTFPFKRWQWFTVNSSLAWRDTFYSRSYAGDGTRTVIDESVHRRFFTVAARMVGPVFNRVWNTPDNGYAERFKHTVEPFMDLSRTSSIDNYSRIVQTDGIDNAVGNATNYGYGLNNRFYARRRLGQTSQAQEILSVGVSQTYFSDPRSALNNQENSTGGGTPSNFSPIFVNVNSSPAPSFNASMRAEIDSQEYELRTMSISGGYNWNSLVQTNVGWTRRFFIANVLGFDDPNRRDQAVNVSTNLRTRNNRLGGLYNLSYDVAHGYFVNQSVQAFYNAQCCGIAMQYSQLGAFPGVVLPRNRTFFVSFTLAGLGNFSPFSGALGAVPR
jgi:hypothetical protein